MAQAISSRSWFESDGVFVYCDNESAIDLSKNSMYHARANHIDVRYDSIREEVESESFH